MNTQPFLAAAHRPLIHDTRSEAVLIRTPRLKLGRLTLMGAVCWAMVIAGFGYAVRIVSDHAHPPHAVAQGVDRG